MKKEERKERKEGKKEEMEERERNETRKEGINLTFTMLKKIIINKIK